MFHIVGSGSNPLRSPLYCSLAQKMPFHTFEHAVSGVLPFPKMTTRYFFVFFMESTLISENVNYFINHNHSGTNFTGAGVFYIFFIKLEVFQII